jgi:hypothetical protein
LNNGYLIYPFAFFAVQFRGVGGNVEEPGETKRRFELLLLLSLLLLACAVVGVVVVVEVVVELGPADAVFACDAPIPTATWC